MVLLIYKQIQVARYLTEIDLPSLQRDKSLGFAKINKEHEYGNYY